MLTADEFASWLRLLETPGLGREQARRLLASFGSPDAALSASTGARQAVVGLALAKALATPSPTFDERLSAARRWFADGPGRHAFALGDPAYPPRLLQTADPPLLLYLQGRHDLLAADSLAIVGSRNPTPQGEDNARDFARELCAGGLAIVSGLALGIDGAAHEGALLAEGGEGDGVAGTVAVVGTGLDQVYPSRHRALARRIAERGLLLSEYAPGTPPLQPHFPQRNRIIAGLGLGTLVVEATLRSGSLITARLASEAGREVFAVPGSIHAPQAKGCHALIKQGAKLAESAEDILEELRGQRLPPSDTELPGDGDPLLDALGHDPVTLDALQARTGWPTADLAAKLLTLELDGAVARLPGGLFQRRTRT